ncbi:MAG TPA: DUF6677 family protein [Pyrinomonadaceae bacterium]|nr:DUF6677 family protein [Pyrinomonadaceae bacterium]
MVKTERVYADAAEPTPGSAWLIGGLAWFVPGLGHLLQRKWWRGLLMGGAVWLSFFIGFAMGGHMFDLNAPEGSSQILQVPPMIGNLGTGALYIVSWLLGYGFADDPQQAARATYEYGNMILLLSGLLNYLTMLDAFDIAVGRKP